jgi:hypothetical protein
MAIDRFSVAFIRRRVRLELQLLRYLKGSHDMSSPQFDALVQAVANLSSSSQAAVQTISAHAAVAVDLNALANLTAQVQAATDALNQAVAASPAPAQG